MFQIVILPDLKHVSVLLLLSSLVLDPGSDKPPSSGIDVRQRRPYVQASWMSPRSTGAGTSHPVKGKATDPELANQIFLKTGGEVGGGLTLISCCWGSLAWRGHSPLHPRSPSHSCPPPLPLPPPFPLFSAASSPCSSFSWVEGVPHPLGL